MDTAPEMAGLRARIDDIDRRLVGLLSERAQVVVEMGALKKRLGLAFRDPRRERAVLEKVCQANPGPLSDERLRDIFAAILASMDPGHNPS